MFLRRKTGPEFPIDHDEVLDIIQALADIKAFVIEILGILSEEEDDEP